jgi:hypothetical protein
VALVGEMSHACNVLSEDLNGRDHLKDLGKNGRMMMMIIIIIIMSMG